MRPANFLVALAALASLGTAPIGGAPLKLERVVVIERHGVRAPTKSVDALSKYSIERWPDWPVAVGELTPHGADNVRLMGGWLRHVYAAKGLTPASGCPAPGAVYAWADGGDQRTRVSGQTLLDGAFPGCGLIAHHGPEGQADPLFDAASSGACPIDAEAARAAVLSRAHGDLDHPGPGYEAARSALSEILAPSATPKTCTDAQGVCFLAGHNDLRIQNGALRLDGPLGTSATLTESLLLEYAQDMPASGVGWGRAGSEATIASVMPLHEIESDLMRRTPYLAGHNGALLARAVADAIDGRPALPGQTEAAAKFVAIAGHDTNLSNLAGMLDVDWTLAGQPDKTPPDAAMVFEVWRDPATGARFVKVALIYQTLAQLRAGAPLDDAHPAGRVYLALPGCADGPGGACPAAEFRQKIEAAIPANCRR
jgi:4-phytase/acid phosphatase